MACIQKMSANKKANDGTEIPRKKLRVILLWGLTYSLDRTAAISTSSAPQHHYLFKCAIDDIIL